MQEIKNLYQAILRLLRATALEYKLSCMLQGNVSTELNSLQLFHNIACGQKVSSFKQTTCLGDCGGQNLRIRVFA